jgi:5-methylthioadenosine/S-adenosylhomocysteine deaminase
MAQSVIRNCSVLVVPEVGERRVDDAQDIHIEDGRITAVVSTVASAPPDPAADHRSAGVEVIDGTGLIAVPGLTNSHTHSPMVMMRGAADERQPSPRREKSEP